MTNGKHMPSQPCILEEPLTFPQVICATSFHENLNPCGPGIESTRRERTAHH